MIGSFCSGEVYNSAVILKLIEEWTAHSKYPLGRTIIQKLCYFAQAIDIPLGYRFSVYQYGPYSQELYNHIDDMVMSGLIKDENISTVDGSKTGTSSYALGEPDYYLPKCQILESETKDKIKQMVSFFKENSPNELELLSTTHYYYIANKNYYKEIDDGTLKSFTLKSVVNAKKDKFSISEIDMAYLSIKSCDIDRAGRR